MSHSDKTTDKQFEQAIKDSYSKVSQETSSPELDASIMAMAKDHLQQAESSKPGWLTHIFNSKKAKYAFSVATAMVMTVGIARFMVYLSQTDQSAAQNVQTYSAKQTAPSDMVAFEVTETAARAPTYTTEKKEAKEVPNLVTNAEMEKILASSPEVARVDSLEDTVLEEIGSEQDSREKIVVTGSRIKANEHELNEAQIAKSKVLAVESKAVKSKTLDSFNAGVLDEAVLGYPLPEVWLEEIQLYLAAGDQVKVLEEWQQFKNTYPDYQVSAALLEHIQKIKKIGQKNNKN